MPSPVTGTTTGGVASTLRTTYTTPLLAAIQPGATILASHLNSITDFINAVSLHTHSLQEYTSLYEFGNTNGGTILNSRTTSTSGATTIGSYVAAAGSTITAVHHNTLGAAANSNRSHSHTFSDDVP